MEPDFDEPLSLPGAGLSGARMSVTPTELAKRANSMEQLLMHGVSDETIARTMQSEYSMTESESEQLQVSVAQRILAESAARSPYKKALAEKRLHNHIMKASKRNAFGAVANLEGQLARIQGTEEPVESKVTIHARLQTATLHLLASMPQEQVDELIAEELALAAGSR